MTNIDFYGSASKYKGKQNFKTGGIVFFIKSDYNQIDLRIEGTRARKKYLIHKQHDLHLIYRMQRKHLQNINFDFIFTSS